MISQLVVAMTLCVCYSIPQLNYFQNNSFVTFLLLWKPAFQLFLIVFVSTEHGNLIHWGRLASWVNIENMARFGVSWTVVALPTSQAVISRAGWATIELQEAESLLRDVLHHRTNDREHIKWCKPTLFICNILDGTVKQKMTNLFIRVTGLQKPTEF